MSVSSTATEPVETLEDILSGVASTEWTNADPQVFRWWEHSQSERGPGQGQPAHIYILQTTNTPVDPISADGILLEENPTLEVFIYTFSETETGEYARDVIQILSQYFADNQNLTEYFHIEPSGIEDFREQKVTQQTEHYVYTVEIEMQKLTDINT